MGALILVFLTLGMACLLAGLWLVFLAGYMTLFQIYNKLRQWWRRLRGDKSQPVHKPSDNVLHVQFQFNPGDKAPRRPLENRVTRLREGQLKLPPPNNKGVS